jgi:iron complex transport system ATP-binding protein
VKAVLRAESLGLSRGGQRALDGVSLALKAGEWAAVVGPNGSGKSTLLSVLAGLLSPDAGNVFLHDRPLADWPAAERARELAWLAQAGPADGEIAVRDLVRLGRLPRHGLFGRTDATDDAAVDAALDETAATAFADRRVSELSGGERQRVLLARVWASPARVLLLDEPTTHLDAPHQQGLLRQLRARAGAGACIATVLHDLTHALAADRLLVMARGRLVADGAPADPAVQRAVVAVFDGAFTIESVTTAQGPRWVAVPVA